MSFRERKENIFKIIPELVLNFSEERIFPTILL
jgi:hypothetical protein